MGFCGSMGADYIQYLIADPVAIPRHLRSFYHEKILSLPHSYFVNDHKQSLSHVVDTDHLRTLSRSTYGISEDKFVYCNFNQNYKIDPEIFKVWMKILKRVPNAILWLLRFPPAAEANLLKEAKKFSIREDRLIFSDVAPREEHIQRGYLADLFLDTTLCNAHTTAVDILWSGTPMITLPGEKMAARVAASLLTAAGLADQLVVKSLEGEKKKENML